jgi:C4-dicarboxylate-specific signal transduction histidine kinase
VDTQVFIELATRFGLPLTILGLVLWFGGRYHATVVKEKDKELQRINDARVAEAQAATAQLLAHTQQFMELLGETDTTLKMTEQTLRQLQHGAGPGGRMR